MSIEMPQIQKTELTGLGGYFMNTKKTVIAVMILGCVFSCTLIAEERNSGAKYYVEKSTWAESMLASRNLYLQNCTESVVSVGPWFKTETMQAKGFADAFFPEEGVDLKAKDKNGKALWTKKPGWEDGKIYELGGGHNVITYLYRVINSDKAATIKVSFGSNDGMELWLNGKKLFSYGSCVVKGSANLALNAGANKLLMKVHNKSSYYGFDFAVLEESAVLQLWHAMEKKYPTQCGWMANELGGNEYLKWIYGPNGVEAEKIMIESVLEDLGADGTKFKKEYDLLIKQNVSNEDRRWLDLYVKSCLHRENFELLKEVRGIVKKMPGSKKLLSELSRYERQLDEMRQRLPLESPEIAKLNAKFQKFVQGVYRSQLDSPLLFVKRNEYWSGHIYDDYLTWHPGGGIYVIENPWAPIDKHIVRAVIDPHTKETLGEGVYRDPDISYDGKWVLFAFKGKNNGNTSIYEIGIDGTGLRRLTDPVSVCNSVKPQPGLIGAGHHDVTPCYLPNGRIAFTSTRTGGHVMCFSSYIDILHTMDADGNDIKCISVNNQNEFDPSVLADGKILYGRWEYIDKTALYIQSLWVVNPDGTNETAVFANNLAKPTAVLDGRAVPNSHLIVASLTGHNDQAAGAIAMIDPRIGKNSLKAITNFTPEYSAGTDLSLKQGPSDPWPISEDVVLIANNAKKHGPHGVIEMITRAGFRTVIHREPDITCYSPMLVKARKIPPVIPSMIDPDAPGKFMVHDIYQGLDGIKRGDVKWLRVIESTSRVSGIPRGGRWWNQAFLISWQGSYDVKDYLGIVEVEKDGSVFFEAPVEKALYFQALDKNKRLIQSQRTFVQSVPGVTRSCTGCHIKDDNAAPRNRKGLTLAAAKAPAKLKPESWGSGYVDYPTMVQPILDRRCVSCHGGEKGIKGGIDLSGGWTYAFNISYETLIKNTLVGFLDCRNGAVQSSGILDPKMHGSGHGVLGELLVNNHSKRLSEKEMDLILAWMDGNCNYYGTWDYSEHAVCKSILSAGNKLSEQMKSAGCVECHKPVVGNDWINLKTPERSRVLRAPLAKSKNGLGLSLCRKGKARGIDYPLIGESSQPPDIFHQKKKLTPNNSEQPVISFADTSNESYQAMLKIIQEAKQEALRSPRVDMPGAEIVRGKKRILASSFNKEQQVTVESQK